MRKILFCGFLFCLIGMLTVGVGSEQLALRAASQSRGGDPGVQHIVIIGSEDVPGLTTYPYSNNYGIAIGTSHFVAQYFDNTSGTFKIGAWGLNDYGQTDVPAGLTSGTLAAGRSFSLLLKSDSTVVAWGKMYQHGAPSDSTPGTYIPAYVPADLTDVQQLVASNQVVLALKTDGTVVQWGWAYCTEHDDAGCPYDSQIVPPAGLTDVVSIDIYQSDTRTRAVALKNDGTVVTWGSTTYNAGIPATVPTNSVVKLGEKHALVWTSANGLIGWGDGTQSTVTAANAETRPYVSVAAAREYSIIATNNGTSMFAWGDHAPGTIPSFPPPGTRNAYVNAVFARGNHVVILYTDFPASPTPTVTLNGSETASRTPTITPTPSKTATASRTPSQTRTATATRTPSATKAPKPTKTATRTRTNTLTPSATRTKTLSPTKRTKPTKTPRIWP